MVKFSNLCSTLVRCGGSRRTVQRAVAVAACIGTASSVLFGAYRLYRKYAGQSVDRFVRSETDYRLVCELTTFEWMHVDTDPDDHHELWAVFTKDCFELLTHRITEDAWERLLPEDRVGYAAACGGYLVDLTLVLQVVDNIIATIPPERRSHQMVS